MGTRRGSADSAGQPGASARPAGEELALLTAGMIAAGIAARRFSSLDVAKAVLRRMERLEPALNAMVCFDERALDAARAADAGVTN